MLVAGVVFHVRVMGVAGVALAVARVTPSIEVLVLQVLVHVLGLELGVMGVEVTHGAGGVVRVVMLLVGHALVGVNIWSKELELPV